MTRNVEIYDNICGNPDLKSTNLTARLIWVLAFDQSVVVWHCRDFPMQQYLEVGEWGSHPDGPASQTVNPQPPLKPVHL